MATADVYNFFSPRRVVKVGWRRDVYIGKLANMEKLTCYAEKNFWENSSNLAVKYKIFLEPDFGIVLPKVNLKNRHVLQWSRVKINYRAASKSFQSLYQKLFEELDFLAKSSFLSHQYCQLLSHGCHNCNIIM